MTNLIPDPRQLDLESAIHQARMQALARQALANTTVVEDGDEPNDTHDADA